MYGKICCEGAKQHKWPSLSVSREVPDGARHCEVCWMSNLNNFHHTVDWGTYTVLRANCQHIQQR